jgi:hypothetical protein
MEHSFALARAWRRHRFQNVREEAPFRGNLATKL